MSSNRDHVFFCSGARNVKLLAPLSTKILHFEVDERIASYKALGLCKALQKPVIICTTSGTAVSECLSAMVEAFYSEAPLVLVSADRPKELQGTGAPQTIDHEVITRNYRRSFYEIEYEDFEKFDFNNKPYPLHLNVLIRTKDEAIKTQAPKSFVDFSSFLEFSTKPLFIFAQAATSLRPLIVKFKALELPFYAEALSGGHDLSPIKTEKALLELVRANHFNGVVRIGHTPLSKVWRILESMDLPVYSYDSRNLKALSHGSLDPSPPQKILENNKWWDALHSIHPFSVEDNSLNFLTELCHQFPAAEISLFKNIHDLLEPGTLVYVGNSLPIRYFEMVQTKEFEIFANRGANGIDGQLSSAIGLALSTEKAVFCILGDLTLTYDLSALLNLPPNLHVIVINNFGGRIFETLNLDQRLIMAHERNFKDIATGFGLSYSTSLSEIKVSQFTELSPDLEQSRSFLERWNK